MCCQHRPDNLDDYYQRMGKEGGAAGPVKKQKGGVDDAHVGGYYGHVDHHGHGGHHDAGANDGYDGGDGGCDGGDGGGGGDGGC